MQEAVDRPSRLPSWTQLGAVLAATGASLCCVVPLLLVLLGIGGAWAGSLTALAPYHPFFAAIAISLLVLAGWQLYRRNDRCDAARTCAAPAVQRRQRQIFWLVTVTVALLLSFPYYAPALL